MTDSPTVPAARPDVRVVCVVYHPGDELATLRPHPGHRLDRLRRARDRRQRDRPHRRAAGGRRGRRRASSRPARTSGTAAERTWARRAPRHRGSSSPTPTSSGSRGRSTRSSRPAGPSPRRVRRARAAQHGRHGLPVGARAPVPDAGCGARAVRADLAGQPVDPPLPRARAGHRDAPAPRGGSRGRACCCGARRSRPSAGSTTATSCSSRTSTSASGWAAPGGPTSTCPQVQVTHVGGTSWRAQAGAHDLRAPRERRPLRRGAATRTGTSGRCAAPPPSGCGCANVRSCAPPR